MEFNIGDKVKVINFGSMSWEFKENKTIEVKDVNPGLIGQIGIIVSKVKSNIPISPHQYAIDGIKGKHAWYIEPQLEMVNKNPNYE